MAQREDPSEKLDDVIRLLQVLGIGLTRLAASRKVDRAQLTSSPLHPAIEVRSPDLKLTPETLVAELNSNRLHGHSRAIAIDRALQTFDESTLADLAPALFGDGSVSALVAVRYAAHPEIALAAAREILTGDKTTRRYTMRGYSSAARVAKFTAIELLCRLGTAPAREVIQQFLSKLRDDATLQTMAVRALGPKRKLEPLDAAVLAGFSAGNREDRSQALHRVAHKGLYGALPHVRRLAATDPSLEVRHRAWFAQATLLDVDAVPLWISALQARAANDDAAREALHALGRIGDNRAIAPMLEAFAESYKPGLVAEALQSFGVAVVPALLDLVMLKPELADRKAAADLLVAMEGEIVRESIEFRLESASPEELPARAQSFLKLAKSEPLKEAVAAIIEKQIEKAGPDYSIPSDLKRALSRAKAKQKTK